MVDSSAKTKRVGSFTQCIARSFVAGPPTRQPPPCVPGSTQIARGPFGMTKNAHGDWSQALSATRGQHAVWTERSPCVQRLRWELAERAGRWALAEKASRRVTGPVRGTISCGPRRLWLSLGSGGRTRRDAGAVERGGLENRCAPSGAPWVRIPLPPPRRPYADSLSTRGWALKSPGIPLFPDA